MQRINFKPLLACLLIVFNTRIIAQNNKSPREPLNLKTTIDKLNKKASLEFNVPVEEDVLILVTDSNGLTIFLENKYRFKGKYSRSIELPGKGPFNLTVSRSDENINRKLEVK